MHVPQPSASAAAEPVSIDRQGTVDSTGVVVVDCGQPEGGDIWYVSRMVVEAPDSAPGECKAFVYVGSIGAGNLRDATSDASFDVADNVVPLVVRDGNPLLVVFAGGQPGKRVFVGAQVTKVHP